MQCNDADQKWDIWPRELAKLYHDYYPNVIVLANGYWFVTYSMKEPQMFGDQMFVSFELDTGKSCDNCISLSLCASRCLNKIPNMRDICVNVSQISSILEFDS